MIISGRLQKNLTSNNEVIVLDGIWGGGKSILFPLVSAFKGVHDPSIDSSFEEIVRLWGSGRISNFDSRWLIQNHLDRSIYYKKIGRNVNLKLIDDTGFYGKKNILKTLCSLVAKEDLSILNDVEQKKEADFIVTHMLNPCYQDLKNLLDHRLKFIEVVRHPLFVIKHIAAYLNRWSTLRDFNMSQVDEGIKIPAFINNIAEYKSGSILEKSAMVLDIYYKEIFHCDKNIYDQNRIFINFEDICFNPDHSMEQLSRFLGRNPDVNVFRIYRKIKIPRINILGGMGKAKYGWSGLHRDVGDQEYMISVIQELKSEMKPKVLDEFFRLCEEYESKFQSKICKQVSYA